MKTLKIFCIVLFLGVISVVFSELGEQLSLPGTENLIPTVEARVGRPLTPVSVAGVARRSVRRCAVGVYRCSIQGEQSSEIRLVLISSMSI